MYRGYDGAGVHYTELEVLPDFSGINTLSTGIVGGASRGPLTKQKITNAKQLRKIYGDPVEGDWGLWAALKVLKNSNLIWYKRVVSSAAKKGVATIAGKKCKYSFVTKDYDEYLNGAKVVVTVKPGTSHNETSIGDEVLVKLVRGGEVAAAEEGQESQVVDGDVITLASGQSINQIKKVYADVMVEDQKITYEYTEGTDFTVDFATGKVTWIAREGSPVGLPAIGGEYYVLYVPETLKTISELDRFDVVLSKNGTALEKLTNFTEAAGDDCIVQALGVRSDYLECVVNEVSGGDAYEDLNGTYVIAGGNAGIEGLSDGDYVGQKGTDEGLQDFLDPEALDISTLIVPGVSSDTVIYGATEVAESRGDIIYIAEIPQGLTPQQADKFSRRKGDWTPTPSNKLHQIDSKFVAMYYPWVLEYVSDWGKNCYTPPSAWAAAQFAYNDTVAQTWFAPAGFQSGTQGRGVLTSALGLEHNCTAAERDILYADDNGCVNPIVGFVGKGITIWGNKTTLRTSQWAAADSSWTQLSVRRLCNYCRKLIIKTSMETLFQPNTDTYWRQWRNKVETELQRIKDGDGIEAYRVQMDRSTISDEDLYYGRAPGKVFIKPVHAIEWIPITFTVTHDSVVFEEGNTTVEEL